MLSTTRSDGSSRAPGALGLQSVHTCLRAARENERRRNILSFGDSGHEREALIKATAAASDLTH